MAVIFMVLEEYLSVLQMTLCHKTFDMCVVNKKFDCLKFAMESRVHCLNLSLQNAQHLTKWSYLLHFKQLNVV